MPVRVKKLVAFAIFLPVVTLYFFAAAALGEVLPNHQLLKFPYYLVAGIAWAFPARILFLWAEKQPEIKQKAPIRD